RADRLTTGLDPNNRTNYTGSPRNYYEAWAVGKKASDGKGAIFLFYKLSWQAMNTQPGFIITPEQLNAVSGQYDAGSGYAYPVWFGGKKSFAQSDGATTFDTTMFNEDN